MSQQTCANACINIQSAAQPNVQMNVKYALINALHMAPGACFEAVAFSYLFLPLLFKKTLTEHRFWKD